MHNLVLSPIDPETLIKSISDRVTSNILEALTPSTPTDQKELLSLKEAAKFLSLSTATIYSKVSRRELPTMKKNGRLYFMQSELMDYLKTGRKETLAEIKEVTLDNLRKKGGKV